MALRAKQQSELQQIYRGTPIPKENVLYMNY